nr:GNAT family N-acetyltransferase [Pseudomonadales bacterium]
MFTVENLICSRWPGFAQQHRWLRSPLLAVLRLLFHESRFRQFAEDYPHLRGMDFVDQVLEYFDFSYAVRSNERERIPAHGAVVIVSNHPIGSLDGLALLRLVNEIRPDVKAVANELLMALEPLHSLLLPVDAMGGRTARDNIRRIEAHLGAGGALVIF